MPVWAVRRARQRGCGDIITVDWELSAGVVGAEVAVITVIKVMRPARVVHWTVFAHQLSGPLPRLQGEQSQKPELRHSRPGQSVSVLHSTLTQYVILHVATPVAHTDTALLIVTDTTDALVGCSSLGNQSRAARV